MVNTKIVAIVAVSVLVVAGAAGAIIFLATHSDDDEGSLPAKFDQRDKGIVTSVKYQNPWGTCWSFGSTGAAETSVLTYLGMTTAQYKEKNGYDLDFSEKHLAWFALNTVTENESDSQSGEGFMLLRADDYHYIYDNGGKATMAASLYSTGVGPVLDRGDPMVIDPLFSYCGETGITAKDYFGNDTQGIANTKDYLDFFAKDQLNSDDYPSYLEDVSKVNLNNLLNLYREWGVQLDDSFDADYVKDNTGEAYDVLVGALRTYYTNKYTNDNEYSEMDNWAIPLDAYKRNLTAGYTMINGNSLLNPYNVSDDDRWNDLSEERMELIKKELYAGHGMGMSYYYSIDTLNVSTWSQFTKDDMYLGKTNHAIQVVGWDDNYSKSNFKDTPERDGAWLCKNSWGSQTDYNAGDVGYQAWGIKNDAGLHTGYFWLSYCDRSINRIISYEFGKAPADQFNAYVYDFLPSYRENTIQSSDVLKVSNVFTITGAKEKMESVSIKTGYYDSDVRISVYRLNDGFANPEDGTLLWSTSMNFQLEGFHRITVDKDVEMTEGQKIAVVVEEKNSHVNGGKDGTLYIADYNYGYGKEKATEETKDNPSFKDMYCVTKVNPNESFLFNKGEWRDWSEAWAGKSSSEGLMIDNFRIKMFSVDA